MQLHMPPKFEELYEFSPESSSIKPAAIGLNRITKMKKTVLPLDKAEMKGESQADGYKKFDEILEIVKGIDHPNVLRYTELFD